MLEINGLLKFTEEDIFNEGCQPDTSQLSGVDVNFKAETQTEIIERICVFLGIENDKENYLLNSCDEAGRIDFQLMEGGDGCRANDKEMEEWEKGCCKLWVVTYSAYVEQVERQAFVLTE